MLPEISFSEGTYAYQSFDGKGAKPLIRFTAGFSDYINSLDYAVVYFDPKSTLEFDGQLDALKLMNSDINVPNMYFITPADINLQIYALPPVNNTICKVPIGIMVDRDGYVIIRLRDIDPSFSHMRISISDLSKGAEQQLLPDNEYKIYLTAGEYKNRFFLKLSDITTDIQDYKSDIFRVYYSNGVLKAEINVLTGKNNMLMISNILGQTISLNKIYESGSHEFRPDLKQGIYVITFISDNVRISKKIFIK